MVKLEGEREETHSFANYSWTEHMGRKWGQWLDDLEVVLDQLWACGFDLTGGAEEPLAMVGSGEPQTVGKKVILKAQASVALL